MLSNWIFGAPPAREKPFREELLSIERLEERAMSDIDEAFMTPDDIASAADDRRVESPVYLRPRPDRRRADRLEAPVCQNCSNGAPMTGFSRTDDAVMFRCPMCAWHIIRPKPGQDAGPTIDSPSSSIRPPSFGTI